MAASPDDPEPVGRSRVDDEADENREGSGLGGGGHEAHHRRRRALVDVGRPDVEGSAGDLEAEAGEDEGHGDVGQRLDVGGGAERGRDVKDVGGAGGAVEQGNAVEEEAGGEGAEEEILHRAFGALGGVAAEAGQDVAGDGRDFQGDEDEHQLDRRGHEAHAHRAEQDQSVVFAMIDLLEGQVVERHEDGGQGDQQDHDVEEDAEVIDPDHVAEAEAGKGAAAPGSRWRPGRPGRPGRRRCPGLCGCVRRATWPR